MKNYLYFGLLVVLLGVAVVLSELALAPQEPTMAPGAETPSVVATTSEPVVSEATTTLEFAVLGTPYQLGENTIVLTEIIEDSRCPSDVTCIQAGTVRVRGLLSTAEESFERTFTLGEPVTIAGQLIVLSDVLPRSLSTVNITQEEYEFYFTRGE